MTWKSFSHWDIVKTFNEWTEQIFFQNNQIFNTIQWKRIINWDPEVSYNNIFHFILFTLFSFIGNRRFDLTKFHQIHFEWFNYVPRKLISVSNLCLAERSCTWPKNVCARRWFSWRRSWSLLSSARFVCVFPLFVSLNFIIYGRNQIDVFFGRQWNTTFNRKWILKCLNYFRQIFASLWCEKGLPMS